MIPDFIA
jgi:hypothetical protein